MENSIAHKFPQLIDEWANDANGELTPQNTSYGSTRKITWRCSQGHEWQTTPNTRTRGGNVRPCPYCSGRKVLTGENDLATRFPHLVAEWAVDLNDELTPQNVLPGSDKKVWWRCAQGHEWQTRVNVRTLNKTGCPVCANNMVYLEEYNITAYPEILTLWDAERNEENPTDIYVSSNQDLWWKCRYRHRWQAPPSRVFRSFREHAQRGETHDFACPQCARENSAGRTLRPRFVDVHPELLHEWDWQKNEKEPYTLTLGSEVKAWWRCTAHGHSWQAQVRTRVRGSGCPYCSNYKILPGFNDLQTLNPWLASFWHPTLNGDLLPSMLPVTSHQKVHWLCGNGHHSVASPAAKSLVKTGQFSCKECAKTRSRSSGRQ